MPPDDMHFIILLQLPDQAPLPDQILYVLRERTPGYTEGPYYLRLPGVMMIPGPAVRIARAVKPVVARSLTGATVTLAWTRAEVMMMCCLLMVTTWRPRLPTRLLAPLSGHRRKFPVR